MSLLLKRCGVNLFPKSLKSSSFPSEPLVAVSHRSETPGSPDFYDEEDVKFVKGMIKESTNALGGLGTVVQAGDVVAIKVNAAFDTPPGLHTTDPRVIEALVELINEESDPSEILIVENSSARHMLDVIGMGATTKECYKACGIEDAAKRVGAKLVALEEDQHEMVEIPNAQIFTHFMCPKTLLNADKLIFVPHMKTHVACKVTLSIKLNQGSIPTPDKIRCHRADLHQKLVDLLKVLKPNLSIIDGIWAEQGQGPTSPYEQDIIKDMNTIIAGKDLIAVDAVGSAIMGFNPLEVNTIRIAQFEGLGVGDLDKIEVKGPQINEVKRHFHRPCSGINGIFPNVNVYTGGACEGCITLLRIYLDDLHAAGLLKDLPKKLNIIVGYKAVVPRNLKDPTLVIGDCSFEHRNKGVFVEGCSPLSKIFLALYNEIDEMLE